MSIKIKLNGIITSGLPLILFLSAFILHITFAVYMSDAISGVERLGQLSGIIYLPAMLIFPTPSLQYTAILVINGALASLISVIAYKITIRIGVKSVWQRLLSALTASIYPAVITHTKSVSGTDLSGNETLAFLFPCIIALIILTAGDTKMALLKHFLAVISGLVTVTAIFIVPPPTAISVAASAILVVILVHVFLKKETVPIVTLIASLIVFYLIADYLSATLWAGETEISIGLPIVKSRINPEGLFRMITAHLYYFAVSTWGLGIIGMCLFVKSIGTKIDTLPKAEKNSAPAPITILSAFSFVSVVFTLVVSVFTARNYIDSITPLVIISIVCCIFVYGLDLRVILSSTVVLGVIFTAYFVLSPETAGQAEHITVSAVFSLMALLIVIICCGGRYRTRIVAAAIAGVSLYSCVYSCTVQLPEERNRVMELNAPIHQVSDLLYNSADAPPVIIANSVTTRTSSLLRFLNRHANIERDENQYELPENYFAVLPSELPPYLEEIFDNNKNCLLLGTTERYKVFAIGEKAIMYVKSQRE